MRLGIVSGQFSIQKLGNNAIYMYERYKVQIATGT